MTEFISITGLVTGITSLIGIGIVYGTIRTKIENHRICLDAKADKQTVNAQFQTVNTKIASVDEKLDLVINLLNNKKR
ncbi:MAG: hypothetical protein PHC43_00875 [Candidatus Marinimicrobia bacterium]|nr:hypothetical protein [Candidatus Neomarinimicrobiota bacterium]